MLSKPIPLKTSKRYSMNRFMRFCLLLLLSYSALAKTGNFEQIQIRPSHSLNEIYDNAEKVFAGQICFRRVRTSAVPFSCGTLTEITTTHKLRFFYPDLNSEITDDVTLEDAVGVQFSYMADTGSYSTPPVFYAVVELLEEDLINNVRTEKYLAAEVASHAGSAPPELVQDLAAIRTSLKDDYPAAVYEWPSPKRMMMNPPFKYTTHNRNYRLEVLLDRSDYFENEGALAKFKLKSLRPGAQPQDIYYIGVDQVEAFSSNVKTNYFEIGNSFYGAAGVKSLEFRTSSAGRTFHVSTIPFEVDVPFFEDETDVNIYYETYLVQGDRIQVTLEKQFGRVFTSGLTATIRQNLDGGGYVDVPAVLNGNGSKLTNSKNGIGAGSNLTLESVSNELSEGSYQIILQGTDTNGNYINEDFSVIVDLNPPIIEVAFEDNYVTNQAEIVVPISAIDITAETIRVLKDGSELWLIFGSGWEFPLSLEEGENVFTIEATDAVGNVTELNWTAILDTSSP